MGFKKAKTTFLMSAGRMGAPSARKPMAKKYSVPSGKKPPVKNVATYVVGNGRPLKTGPMKGAVNSYRTAKKAPGKTSSVRMARKPAGRSATNSPQSAMMAMKPRG